MVARALTEVLQRKYCFLKKLYQFVRQMDGTYSRFLIRFREYIRNLAVLEGAGDWAVYDALHAGKLKTEEIDPQDGAPWEQIDILPSSLELVDLFNNIPFRIPAYPSSTGSVVIGKRFVQTGISHVDVGHRLRLLQKVDIELDTFGLPGSVICKSLQLGFEPQIVTELASLSVEGGGFLISFNPCQDTAQIERRTSKRNPGSYDATANCDDRGKDCLKIFQDVVRAARRRRGRIRPVPKRVVKALRDCRIGHVRQIANSIFGCLEVPAWRRW